MSAALIHSPETHLLGKRDPKPPHLKISDYVDVERALPQAPASVQNSQNGAIPLAVYLNDRYGCCTCSAVGNTLRVNSKGAKQISDSDVQTAYEGVTSFEGAAFNPGPPPVNDNGCVSLDVLDYWSKTGVGGDKLLGHAGVNMQDPNEVRVICWLFGSVYIGVALTVAQQSQDTWDYVAGSADWGKHAVPIFDINPNRLGTWGAYKDFTDAFIAHQSDEGHAVITSEWVAANVSNPLINVAGLVGDFKSLNLAQES